MRVRLYTDGARDGDVVAMGWVIETMNGVEQDHRYMHGDYTSMEAEYFALLDGLRHARRFDDEVMVFTDCDPLVRKMRDSDRSDDVWHDRKIGCDRLLDKFEWWQIKWIPREQNEDANTQATIALRKGRDDC